MTDLGYLSSEIDALIDETASSILSLVNSLLVSGASQTIIDLSLEVFSNISEAASRSSSIGLTSTTQEGVDKIVDLLLPSASTLTLTSPKITLKIQPYDQSTENTITLSTASTTTVILPAGMSDPGDTSRLVTIIYSEPIFEALAPSDFISGSEIITLRLYVNEVEREIQGLSERIELNFALDPKDRAVQACIAAILDGTQTLDDISCSYFDPSRRETSTEGCLLMGVV